jgi:hypothetical protein
VGRGGWLHGREGELLTDLPPRGRVDQGPLERHDHPRTADGVERLGEIRSRVPGLTDRLVAQRLRELEREGVVERAYTAATVPALHADGRGPLTGAGDRVDSPVGCHVGGLPDPRRTANSRRQRSHRVVLRAAAEERPQPTSMADA